MKREIVLASFLVLCGTCLFGQTISLKFDSLPSAQGWSFLNSCASPETSLFSLATVNNVKVLHQTTIGCLDNSADYTLNDVVCSAPYTLTVTARVTSDEVILHGDLGHLGVSFGAEGNGKEYYIGLGPGFIEAVVAPGITVTVLSTSVDTTQFHTYVLSVTPATGDFTLSVDGAQIGSGIGGDLSGSNLLFVGDGSSSGNAVGDYSAYTYQAGCQASQLDPIPDLLSGGSVTTNTDLLASQGRVVQGVAADGVSQLVLRIPGVNTNDQVSITLLNDLGDQSGSASEDGGLDVLGGTAFTSSKINNVNAVSTNSGPMAFALYRAPVDFPRCVTGSNPCQTRPDDAAAASRTVSLQIEDMTTGASSTTAVTILRPPVILVHGFWSSAAIWNNFLPLYGAGLHDSRFYVSTVDYGYKLDQFGFSVSASTPSYPLYDQWRVSNPKASALGVAFNAPQVLVGIHSRVQDFKLGNNAAAIGVAAVQADVVAHSMGGLVTRQLTLLPAYLANETFVQGPVHKVITIDTPHLGTPLATALLPTQLGIDENSCFRNVAAFFDRVSFSSATVNGFTWGGGVGDLTGYGTGGSDPTLSKALQALMQPGPHPLPTAYVAGMAVYPGNGGNLSTSPIAIGLKYFSCINEPLVNDLTPDNWSTVFNLDNDALVPVMSQLNGLGRAADFSGVIHSGATESFGFTGPGMLPSTSDVKNFLKQQVQQAPNQVINLLNTPFVDSVGNVTPPFYSLNP